MIPFCSRECFDTAVEYHTCKQSLGVFRKKNRKENWAESKYLSGLAIVGDPKVSCSKLLNFNYRLRNMYPRWPGLVYHRSIHRFLLTLRWVVTRSIVGEKANSHRNESSWSSFSQRSWNREKRKHEKDSVWKYCTEIFGQSWRHCVAWPTWLFWPHFWHECILLKIESF